MSDTNSGSGNVNQDKPTQLTTGGGAYIGGDVNISGGLINVQGAGRDTVVTTGIPSRVALLQALETAFSLDDLRVLAFDLQVELDNLEGQTKKAISRSLISYMERRRKLPELADYIHKVRPSITFDTTQPVAPPAKSDTYEQQIAALTRQGQQEQLSSNYEAATKTFESLLALAQSAGSVIDHANALAMLAGVYRARRRFDQAIDYYQRSLDLRASLGEDAQNIKGRVTTLRALSNVHVQAGNSDAARKYLDEGLALTERAGDHESTASTLQDQGTLLRAMGDLNGALACFERAEDEWNQVGARLNVALAQNETGVTLMAQGDLLAAQSKLQNAYVIARAEVSPQDMAVILANLGLLAARRADWDGARQVYGDIVEIYRSLRNRAGESAALASLAGAYSNLRQWDQAVSLYQQAYSIALSLDDFAAAAAALVNTGNVHMDRGDLDAALSAYQTALSFQVSHGDQDGAARTQERIDQIYQRRQDTQKPFDLLYAEAQRFFRDAGFSLATTGETDSFLCAPARPNWQKTVKTPVYTRVIAAKRLTSEDVLDVRDAARAAVANANIAFVLVDKDPKDDALLQIITERLNGTTVVPVPAALLYESKSSGKPDPAYVALSEHLRDLLGGADPYGKSSPVTDRMNFVGRDAMAEALMKDMLENGKHIGVFGLRKMGKSSLLRYMQYRMPCPTAWLDLQKGVDLSGVYERALQGWQNDAQSRFGIDLGLSGVKVGAADPSADFVKALGRALEKLGQNSARPAHVALFLDEIEQLMPSSGAGQEEAALALKLMRTLRGLAQEDGTITLMVAGVDPAIIRLSRIGDAQNPFFQLLDEVYLPPISDEACRQLVRNLGALIELNYTDEALDAIVQASGGHPFFARRLCSLLYEKRGRKPGQVALGEVKEGIEDFIYDQKYAAVMDDNGLWGAEVGNARIWGEPIARSNQRILESLSKAKDPQPEPALTEAKTAGAPTERANSRQALTMLNKLAVVSDLRKPPQPGPLYRITFGLFRQWIRQVHLGMDE